MLYEKCCDQKGTKDIRKDWKVGGRRAGHHLVESLVDLIMHITDRVELESLHRVVLLVPRMHTDLEHMRKHNCTKGYRGT